MHPDLGQLTVTRGGDGNPVALVILLRNDKNPSGGVEGAGVRGKATAPSGGMEHRVNLPPSLPLGVFFLPGWQLRCAGSPWWLILPLAAVAVFLLVRLHRRELAAVSPQTRRQSLLLRGSALALLVLFLMEPTLARRTSEKVLPRVAVVVDQSASMAVKDELMAPGAKLSEAIGLGFLPPNVRPLKTNATAQAASDQAVLKDAKKGSPVDLALVRLAGMSRYERAVKLAKDQVVPLLAEKARVSVFAMDTGIVPLDLTRPATLLPNRATDFEASLAALARDWSRDYVGGVVFLSDGRQTAGVDPGPVIRALRARGASISGILVGDPGIPPDAVVAEISGSGEVFLGENVPMTVRHRITGADEMDWDLVITHNQRELARRAVHGNGSWQYDSFAFTATNAGINLYQARLEPAREQTSRTALAASGAITLELWKNINGAEVADLINHPAFKNPPSATFEFSQLDYQGRGEEYGARIRGFLIPPQSGNYTFWIASDDASELWLSASDNPQGKVKLAQVSGYVPRGTWDAQASQKSQPITLKARQPYYFETLHKQGGGEDHLAVGWRLPDGTTERPIPSARFAPYNEPTRGRISQLKREAAQLATNEWKEASMANNTAEFSVNVNQDPIKVLLVDSTPRWESRYLAAMFERDRRVILTRRYHSVILEDKNLALLPKTQAEWDAYDMVCLGDLDTNELPPQQQTFLATFVAQRGGFVVCLAGPRGMPRAFSLGPVAALLPVRPALQSVGEPESVTVELTPEGVNHPVMQVLNDSGFNQKLWPLLPPLQWIANTVVLKPGAVVLLKARNNARTPIIAAQRFGAGRVFWVGTEETWRWRDRLGERVHQTFWLQVMRWGLAGRLRGKDPRLQVGIDRYLMTPAETAELRARVANAKGEPLRQPPMVKLEPIGSDGEPVAEATRTSEMSAMSDAPGIWQLSLSGLAEGSWRVTILEEGSELKGVTETRDIIVRDLNGLEGLELGGDLPNLARLAAAGGHQAGTLDQAEAIVKDLAARLKPRAQEHRETIRLWNNYFALLFVVALLGVEWVLRKRRGLA